MSRIKLTTQQIQSFGKPTKSINSTTMPTAKRKRLTKKKSVNNVRNETIVNNHNFHFNNPVNNNFHINNSSHNSVFNTTHQSSMTPVTIVVIAVFTVIGSVIVFTVVIIVIIWKGRWRHGTRIEENSARNSLLSVTGSDNAVSEKHASK